MDTQDKNRPFGRVTDDARDYAYLKIEEFRLTLVAKLARLFNTILVFLLLAVLAVFAVLLLTVAAVCALALLVHSYLWASLILFGFFVVLFLAAYLLRRRLFINRTVRMFAKVIYEELHKKE